MFNLDTEPTTEHDDFTELNLSINVILTWLQQSYKAGQGLPLTDTDNTNTSAAIIYIYIYSSLGYKWHIIYRL